MAKRKTTTPTPAPHSPAKGFKGARVIQSRIASGVPLRFKADEEAILQFVGKKDIQERVPGADGPVIYYTFFDGKKLVTMPEGYALSEAKELELDSYIHIINAGELDMGEGRADMHDFAITALGKGGDVIECDERYCHGGKMTLSHASMYEANYQRINYPHRSADSNPPADRQ